LWFGWPLVACFYSAVATSQTNDAASAQR